MAITQIIATLPAVLNDSATFYEDIAVRNNSLVTTVLPSINAWATQANTTQTEINAKAAQVAAQAVDGGYSQNYINSNFVGVNNAQNITAIKTFSVSPIVPNATTATQAMAYGQGVNLTTAQTIAGIKTFSSSPIVPTPTTNIQAANKQYVDLKVALADFTGTNVSLAISGYQKLPSGLILQWGLVFSDAAINTAVTWTFPLAFPTASLQVFGTHANDGTSSEKSMVNVYANNATTATLNLSAAGAQNVRMLAIGY